MEQLELYLGNVTYLLGVVTPTNPLPHPLLPPPILLHVNKYDCTTV